MDRARDIEFLKYLLEDIVAIYEYSRDCDEDKFLRDSKTKDAVLTRLMAIGEYGGRLSEAVRTRFSEIDWRTIKSARNYYAHAYRGIDWILVWHVVIKELPAMQKRIVNIIEVLENENNGKTN